VAGDKLTVVPSNAALTIRRARREDIPAIVALLAADPLGATRENPGDPAYSAAFAELDKDPNQILVVAEQAGEVVGALQFTVIPGLARRGMRRAQLEAVRVHAGGRGNGVGGELLGWAIDEARRRGCGLVQLTTDVTRTDAHRFYRRFGFQPSHIGMKLMLDG
jgi:ribosomal protein S18 acetylase RimI-like enzyme